MAKSIIVTGAGAHVPFGMPTGLALREYILWLCGTHEIDGDSPFRRSDFRDMLTNRQLLARLSTEFRNSQFPSIDAFLARNPDFADYGKGAIAATILGAEDSDKILHQRNPGDWLGALITPLSDIDLDRLPDKLAFVTFNYDRCMEHWLYNHLRYGRKYSPEDAETWLQRLDITHVYGSVGTYVQEGPREGVCIGNSIDRHIFAAIDLLGIVAERAQQETVERVQGLISKALSLVFLGFAYDSMNISVLLGHMEHSQKIELSRSLSFFGGTAMGMTKLEVDRSGLTELENFTVGGETQDCLAFVRTNRIAPGV